MSLSFQDAPILDMQAVYDALFAYEVEQQLSLRRENWQSGSGAQPTLQEVLQSLAYKFPFGIDLRQRYDRGVRVLQRYLLVYSNAHPTKDISSAELGRVASEPVLREAGYRSNEPVFELVALRDRLYDR